jgi:hypothetical protein
MCARLRGLTGSYHTASSDCSQWVLPDALPLAATERLLSITTGTGPEWRLYEVLRS